ncbi:MAG TPA: ABC transporter substrate-binding protein [Thermodesulfobacteriota bacterium]|nr:ABC transporter substrate-binding protein [Thermodesulfobacteriota bacterium]
MTLPLRLAPLLRLFAVALLAAAPPAAARPAAAQPAEKLTVMLDWFPNPNHTPLAAARARGDFARVGLEVTLQAPADPSDPLKLAAAGKVDVAIAYQPSVTMGRSEGLPLVAFGVLVDQPLTTVMALERSGIRRVADLKGKRIGYSVPGFEEALLGAVLETAGLRLADVSLVDVHFNLTPALLAGQVAAVVGAYKNYEKIQLELEGERVRVFELTEHGVPSYDELVFVTSAATAGRRPAALRAFLEGVARGLARVRQEPADAFDALVATYPDLKTELNRRAFEATRPLFARRLAPDPARWEAFQRFLLARRVIREAVPVASFVRTDLAPR